MFIALPLSGLGSLIINSDTSSWTPITYSNSVPDAFNDQQTGLKSGDIVGDINHPAFYTRFDGAGTPDLTDGTLAFRVRLNEAKDYKKMTFNYNVFIGMDANQDGAMDLFVGVNNAPQGTGKIAIWDPGPGANTGPSTTTIVISTPQISFTETSGVNYDFSPVSKTMDPSAFFNDVDGGGKTDVFVSFSIDFNVIVSALGLKGIAINQNVPHLNYVLATATQVNSLNMDINGVKNGIGSTQTFAALGALSTPRTAAGAAPEPGVIALLGAGCTSLLIGRRFIRP